MQQDFNSAYAVRTLHAVLLARQRQSETIDHKIIRTCPSQKEKAPDGSILMSRF